MITVDTFEAPAHWASALINGDTSGIEYYGAEALAEYEAWFSEHPYHVVDCTEEPHIGRWNGLLCELLTYTYHVQESA